MGYIIQAFPGLLLVFGLAAISSGLGYIFPIIGAPIFGILLGFAINNTIGKPKNSAAGIMLASKQMLQWAIIVLGTGISLQQVWKTGVGSLSVLIVTLVLSFLTAFLIGKIMKIDWKMGLLIGAGTGICGGSAIAALAPVVQADETEITYSISTIFFYSVVAVLLFPWIGHLLHLSNEGFGLWAGTAVNDTSSVVAAAYSYSNAAGAHATIVKLTRTTFLIPVTLLTAWGVSYFNHKRNVDAVKAKVKFPWFILWFLAAALLNSLGLFNESLIGILTLISKFMITMALCAIGLAADIKKIASSGFKPIVLGLCVWLAVSLSSLLEQWATGQF